MPGSMHPERTPDPEEPFETKVPSSHQYGEVHDKRGLPNVLITPVVWLNLVDPSFPHQNLAPSKLPALNIPWEAEIHIGVEDFHLLQCFGAPMQFNASQSQNLEDKGSVGIQYMGLQGDKVEIHAAMNAIVPPGAITNIPAFFARAKVTLLGASQNGPIVAGTYMRYGGANLIGSNPFLPIATPTIGQVADQAAICSGVEQYGPLYLEAQGAPAEISWVEHLVYFERVFKYKGNEDRFYVGNVVNPAPWVGPYAYCYAVVRAI